MKKVALGAGMLGCLLAPMSFAQEHDWNHSEIKHVLLISIDGMHAVDYLNCKNGIAGVNAGAPYCPSLAELGTTGVNYLYGSTTKPSDSFPGLMGIVTGGTPRTVGAFYDVAYDRSLAPPAKTTGNGVAAGTCTVGVYSGTTTEYEEGIDLDQTKLNGGLPGAPLTGGGGISSIDPLRLPRDPAKDCAPVYPWNFVRTNTIFGVIHAAGGYTSWFDKHPAYSSVNGPNGGTTLNNLDDFYSPEINSNVVALPGVVTPTGLNCSTVLDTTADLTAWTNSFQNIQCYDTLKVNAIINEIDGKSHDGSKKTKVPTIFGMNFQVVSVGQKLVEKSISTSGGYLDAMGTPTAALLSEIEFTDKAIGNMVQELKNRGLYESTLVVITAKHGQNPIDSSHYIPILHVAGGTSPATILDNAGLLPFSEAPSNPTGIGPTEDDISLLWLKDSSKTATAVSLLEANTAAAGIGEIFVGASLDQMFNAPGLPPTGDPRTPDIAVSPNVGVVYTGSTKKLAEHGGFSHDDTNVMILFSNPGYEPRTITVPVETIQVAPTILQALGLDPSQLQAVRKEGTAVLPGLNF
jgi:hypothetical protein